jgi:hypothetical protein
VRRAILLGVLPLAAGACGGEIAAATTEPRGAQFLVERRPDAWTPEALLPDAARRFPSGASIARVGADAAETSLSQGLDAAGAPSVRHDAQAVLFVGRERAGEPLAVWTCAPDGGGRRVAVRHPSDCLSAAFLSDGRIVYAATTDDASPTPEVARGAALFVAKGDGSPGARITFGAGLDADPFVLCDGRVLFSSWRASGRGAFGLYTVFPDGTGFAPFRIADGDALRPRQDADLDVTFALRKDGATNLRRACWDAPMSVETDAAGSADASRVGEAPLATRPRPQGQLSVVREEGDFGTLFCVDARRGAASATKVRVLSRGGGTKTVLGETALASDGSFHVRVPPDTPLSFETLDADGNVVAAERGPIWVRRNEVRGCVGCHDDVETAPPNVRPVAVRLPPVDMSRATGGGR